MRSINKIIIVIFTILFIFSANAFGADALYRLMHNDHDALVIAELIEMDDKVLNFRVEKSIISKKDLNTQSRKKQLNILEFKLERKDLPNISLYGKTSDVDESIKVGDCFLISLNKKLFGYKVAWGIYKTSGLDYKTLDILYPEDASDCERMDAAAIKCFVNSNGRVTEFSFDGTKKIVKSGNKIIYDDSKINNSPTDETSSELLENNDIVIETIAKRTNFISKNKTIKMGILPFALATIALIIALIRSKR